MRITIPVLGFGRAGGNRVIAELASCWVDMGHEVCILSRDSSMSPYFPTRAKIIWLKPDGTQAIVNNPDSAEKRLGYRGVLSNLHSLKIGMETYAFDSDIVLANHALTAWPVSWARILARKFFYVQAYEPEYYALARGLNNRLLQALCTGSYFLPLQRIVNAPIYFKYRFLRAKHFVPPGIDFSLMYPKEDSSFSPTGVIILGCIGRNEPQKGIRYAIEAFNKLREAGYKVKLLIAYGNLPPGLELSPDSEIVTPKNDKELGDFYRSLDILIAPGTVQLGAPHYPVMEAMACGIPVITTGYMPADLSNAWIVQTHDSQSIATTVSIMLADWQTVRNKAQIAYQAIQSFSWEIVSKKMIGIFSE